MTITLGAEVAAVYYSKNVHSVCACRFACVLPIHQPCVVCSLETRHICIYAPGDRRHPFMSVFSCLLVGKCWLRLEL